MKKVLFTATVDSHILHFHLPYLKLFKDNGYEVHVATNGDEKIPYCDVKHKISFERSPIKINNLKAIKDLKKIIDKENFEIIHTHTPMGSVVTRLAAIKARKNGTRVIYTAHGFHFFKGAPIKNWLIFYPIEKILSRITDDLILINNEDYELAKNKLHAKRTHIVPGVGVDPKKFDFDFSEKEKQELRKSLGLKKLDFVMIFPAELNENKNQKMLIEVMNQLVKKEKHKNFKLLLPGQDSLNGEYQQLVKEYKLKNNIKFLGYRKDIPKLLKISDLAVSSSKREGLGLNLIEAMYTKVPVIAVENRGHNEIIKDNFNGLLVEQIDNIAFKNSILKIYSNKSLRNKFINNAYDTSLKFLLNSALDKMNIIYKKQQKSTENNILFVHDGILKMDKEGKYYTIGGFGGKEFENKYLLSSNDKLVYYTRLEKMEFIDQNKYFKINENRCQIRSSKLYKSPIDLFTKHFKIRRETKFVLNDIDMCVIRMPSVLGVIAFYEAKRKKIPVLIELVGCPFQSLIYYGGIKGYLFAPIMYFLTKSVVRNAHYVQYVTSEYLQKKYPNKNGNILACSDVFLEKIDEKNLDKRLKKIKNQSKNDVIKLGLVGSLNVKYKGHEVAIKAISLLKDKYNIELHFLGSGSKEKWKKIAKKYKVENNVFFDGVVPSGQPVMKWLDDMDIHLMMSKTEGLPRVLVEAMSRASISIASNVGGIPELLSKENLLDKNDYVGLARRIEKLINNKELQFKIAKENFDQAKKFDYIKLSNMRKIYYSKIFNEENLAYEEKN